MVSMQSNQSLKDAKTNFEKAYIEQAIDLKKFWKNGGEGGIRTRSLSHCITAQFQIGFALSHCLSHQNSEA